MPVPVVVRRRGWAAQTASPFLAFGDSEAIGLLRQAVEGELVSSPTFPVCREKTGNFKRNGGFRA